MKKYTNLLSATIVTVLLFAVNERVYSRVMPSYDIAALYRMADVVVEVKELGYTEKNWFRTGKVKVIQSYKGSLKAEDEIIVVMNTVYRRHLWNDKPYTLETKKGMTIKYIPKKLGLTKALMFLKKKSIKNDKINHPIRYSPIANGIKYFRKNDVLCYHQWDNPGPFVLSPQKPELIRLKKCQNYAMIELREDLNLAQKRVKRFNEALRSNDLKKLKEYLPLLATQRSRSMHFSANNLSRTAAHKIVELADKSFIKRALDKYENQCEWYVRHVLKDALKS